MLRRVHIRNYLLIEEIDLGLADGLTIITGETGSGKSILIGALGLAMGDRADAGALRDPAKRCVIELEVDVLDQVLEEWFSERELPFEQPTTLRRHLEPGGRSRAFINDMPVKLEELRDLGARLVHVHSQHHTLLLNEPGFQLGLVDHLAGQQDDVVRYVGSYRALRACSAELDALRNEEALARSEADFIGFQLNELDEVAPLVDEQEGLEQDLTRADNAEELINALQLAEDGVSGDRGALALLAELRHVLARPARLDAGVKALLDRLDSVHIELKDIALEASSLASSVSLEPALAQRMRERLDSLIRLQQKHRVKSNAELITVQTDLRERFGRIASLGDRIATVEDSEQQLFEASATLARGLSARRSKAVAMLGKKVEAILHDLGMPHAVFTFDLRSGVCNTASELGPQGLDTVRALFSANKDRNAAPLDKVASGGELGRVMLALISLAADSRSLPTVVFDEIDTGVSGEVADRVGALMARMGGDRQVLAITHLPQIASKAKQHLLVSKRTFGAAVHTRIDALDQDRRVEVLAQMLSGRKLTQAALDNARALLDQA